MEKLYCVIILSAFVFLAVAIHGVKAEAMVTGTVFCDQCKDGQVSLFDYPLSGMKVWMICPGSGGEMTKMGEETTNMLGNYAISFDGTPDLTGCYAQISPNINGPGPNGCGAITGPPKSAKLMFSMFDIEMFSVDPLISQPAQPMSFCPRSSSPPAISGPPPAGPITLVAPPAPLRSLPPLPPIPTLPPMPPLPSVEASACPYEYWMMPEYRCYWRAVNPDMAVAVVFGPLAAKKYGGGMTLWAGLQGKGDPYKTLLREAITALLNSYNSFNFPYHALTVVHHFNAALMGSTRAVLLTALRFKRANSGHGHFSCKFKSCK